MSTPDYSEQQLQEINALDAGLGFPGGIIRAAADPESLVALTRFQADYARNWLRIANARFGGELHGQLGRLPTLDELIARLELSLAMSGVGTDRPTTR